MSNGFKFAAAYGTHNKGVIPNEGPKEMIQLPITQAGYDATAVRIVRA